MKNSAYLLCFVLGLILIACQTEEKLPYLGKTEMVDGETVYHQIPEWQYMDQDSNVIGNNDFKNVVYVADFFFTNCPTICPKVMKEMTRLQDEFKDNPKVKLISFTIDPKRDTPEALKIYAEKIGAETGQWKFVHTNKETIYDLANEHFVVAYEDEEVPGGFDHSGKLILVDKEGHVRSFSEGTDPSTTPKLIKDTYKLLDEYAAK